MLCPETYARFSALSPALKGLELFNRLPNCEIRPANHEKNYISAFSDLFIRIGKRTNVFLDRSRNIFYGPDFAKVPPR